ncbi:MAG: hypothetical protein F4Z41_08725 [Acidimicrobiia bacterium]|nr:hypothetical protein [Acidimicrobiia bacterium]
MTALGDPALPKAALLAELIADSFYGEGFDLSAREEAAAGTWSEMPEVQAVRLLRDWDASDSTVRLFLTFTSAVDRMRDANLLWRAAATLYQSRPDVFEPNQVARMPMSTLRELLSSTGVSRFHTYDSDAWKRIAVSLAKERGPTRRVIFEGMGDAEELIDDVRSKRDGKDRFPQLRGLKIAPMWVRIMAAPGGATISNIEAIPVAVDVQVRRVTENLGVTNTQGLPLRGCKDLIQKAWQEAVSAAHFGGPSQIRGTSAALDPALWLFGARGCSFCEKQHDRIPISTVCDSCQYSPIRKQRIVAQESLDVGNRM